jgi:hypothetical protein
MQATAGSQRISCQQHKALVFGLPFFFACRTTVRDEPDTYPFLNVATATPRLLGLQTWVGWDV